MGIASSSDEKAAIYTRLFDFLPWINDKLVKH